MFIIFLLILHHIMCFRLIKGNFTNLESSADLQYSECKVNKITLEYRPVHHSNWILLTKTSEFSQPLTINVNPTETMYSIRLTAQTSSGHKTMTEYDIDIIPISNGNSNEKQYNEQGFEIDTKTIVSISSSCIVLISGCIAVAFLLIYKKKSSRYFRVQSYHRTSSVSCGGNISIDESVRVPVRSDSSQGMSSSHLDIHHLGGVHHPGGAHPPGGVHQGEQSGLQQIVKKPSLVVLRGKTSGIESTKTHFQQTNSSHFQQTNSPVKGKLPQVQLSVIKHLSDETESDVYNEGDEITPYATFRLAPACDEDKKINDENDFKTFSVNIGEPAYMIKSSMDCAPTTSGNYKIIATKLRDDHIYQCGAQLSHSITSGSSNQEELIRAYEFGRHHPNLSGQTFFDEDEDEFYQSQQSEADTPTDPGIREFTKSPPKPNERRQGEVTVSGQAFESRRQKKQSSVSGLTENSTTTTSESSSSTTPVNEKASSSNFNAMPRERSKKPAWKRAACAKAMHKLRDISSGESSGYLKHGLSSDDEDDRNNTPSNIEIIKPTTDQSFTGDSSSSSSSSRIISKKQSYRIKSDIIDC